MYCPTCEGTKKLGTKRTTAGHREVVREKYCDECQTSFETVERFDMDIHSEKDKTLKTELRLRDEIHQFESQLEEYKEFFGLLTHLQNQFVKSG